MPMLVRWFVGAYCVSVATGFITAPLMFPEAAAPIIGLLFVPFALPFVLVGSLAGWGLQWAVQRLFSPGWERTAILACTAGLIGASAMQLITGTSLYVVTAFFAGTIGAIFSQHQPAWRQAWIWVAVAVAAACTLIISLLRIRS